MIIGHVKPCVRAPRKPFELSSLSALGARASRLARPLAFGFALAFGSGFFSWGSSSTKLPWACFSFASRRLQELEDGKSMRIRRSQAP